MALQRGKLTDIAYIAATAGSIYANPGSTKSYIKAIILHNTNTTSETVTLNNVPDSSGSLGTASTANQFFKKALAADETFVWSFEEYPLVLTDTNDAIFAATTTASKVTVQILGDKDA